MQPSLLPMLRCPSGCAAELRIEVTEALQDEVIAGELSCPSCGARYGIEEGIARMLPPSLSAASSAAPDPAMARKRREMKARDEQVQDYDRMWYLNLFGALEVPLTLRYLRLEPRHVLLEAGCGTGRMTAEFAARCARLVSIDFSWESLRACAAKLRAKGIRNVDLVQADICRLPFGGARFDRVVSCQVLEHVPTPDSRASAIDELARVLAPDGNLALSAYQYSVWTRLFGQKQGEHAGGIPFYRFTRTELRDALARALVVEAITGALVYHYTARCRKA